MLKILEKRIKMFIFHLTTPAHSVRYRRERSILPGLNCQTGSGRMEILEARPAAHLRRALSLWDLILYGIVLIMPIAAVPLFGLVQQLSAGHAVSAILLAMVAMVLTAYSYGRMAAKY